MLAHKFNPKLHVIESDKKRDRPIKDWLIYEKIDGIRAIFKDGELTSRYGNKFHAPQEFIDKIDIHPSMSTLPLDGELVHKNGLQKTASIVKDQTKKTTMEFWKDIQYVVFDTIREGSFNERIDSLNVNLEENENVIVLQPLGSVNKIDDIAKHLTDIESRGGEGLMLRNPNADYKLGRSWDLIKVKSFDDCEAEVIGYYPGEGKYEGMAGGLVCKLNDGTEFEVGTGLSDKDRSNPPAVGKKITINYMGLTDLGKPRHAVYKGIRDYE